MVSEQEVNIEGKRLEYQVPIKDGHPEEEKGGGLETLSGPVVATSMKMKSHTETVYYYVVVYLSSQ